MLYVVYLLASTVGVCSLVWAAWRNTWRHALFTVLGVTIAAMIYWMAAVPDVAERGRDLASAIAMLLVAILLPGGAGAFVTHARNSRTALAGGVLLSLLVWLPMAYQGVFIICGLDTHCDP